VNRSFLLPAAVLLAVSSFSCGGCRKSADQSDEASGGGGVGVSVEIARVQTLRLTVNGPGTVAAAAAGDWTIYPAQNGRIVELLKKEGDVVADDEVLVKFEYGTAAADAAAHELELTSATTKLDAARAQFTRVSSMFERGYTSRSEFEAAQQAVTSAELDVARAQALVQASKEAADQAIVKARFAGVVSKVFHNQGDLVNGSVMDPVMRLVDPSRLEVVMSVPVQELAQIQAGQPATILAANGAEPGVVAVKPTPDDPRAETQEIRLAFAGPTTLTLDAPVQVEIVMAERPDVIAVPSAAVLDAGEGRSFVMIAGADGRAHRREVRLGLRAHDRVEIASGLSAGDRVIVKDVADIAEGTVVSADR
jgi:RND family efflux transporter MFP subunit